MSSRRLPTTPPSQPRPQTPHTRATQRATPPSPPFPSPSGSIFLAAVDAPCRVCAGEDIFERLPEAMPTTAAQPGEQPSPWHPLRPNAAEGSPLLTRAFYGVPRVPLAVHFAGCQLCSGKAPERASKCWPAFRRTVRFAEEQTFRAWGLRHSPHNRSAPLDAPLLPLVPA